MRLLRYRGPVAWTGTEFRALTRDGRRLRRGPRLIAVTHDDGSHHYRIALPWEKSPPVGRLVPLESALLGKGAVSAP